jgi:hypothetical protein
MKLGFPRRAIRCILNNVAYRQEIMGLLNGEGGLLVHAKRLGKLVALKPMVGALVSEAKNWSEPSRLAVAETRGWERWELLPTNQRVADGAGTGLSLRYENHPGDV